MDAIKQDKPRELLVVTFLKGLLCVCILLHHAARSLQVNGFFHEYGCAAVSFFFVISGFLLRLGFKPADSAKDCFSLFWRRVRRLYPLHLITLAFCIAYYHASGISPAGYAASLKETIPSLFLVHDWIPFLPEVRQCWNGVSWYISVMVFCYILYPFVFANTRRIAWVAGLAIVGSCTFALAGAIFGFYQPEEALYFSPLARFAEFMLGAVAALAFKSGAMLNMMWPLAAAAFMLPVAFCCGFGWTSAGFSLAPFFAILLVLLAQLERKLDGRIFRGVLSHGVFMGRISFEFYMVHAIVLGVTINANATTQLDAPWPVKTLIVFVISSVAAFALSKLMCPVATCRAIWKWMVATGLPTALNELRRKPSFWFLLLSISGAITVALCFMLAPEENFWQRYHWYNPREPLRYKYSDSGMDFFHSIEYLHGNKPYAQWRTIYPPFANLIFKLLYAVVPSYEKCHWANSFLRSCWMKTTPYDLRVWLPTFMLFVLFFIFVSLFSCMAVRRYFDKKNMSLLSVMAVFSYGYVYALERGNIIILAMATALVFVMYYDSHRKWLRELAILCLAISANIKLYPALLGMMLLREMRWKESMRAAIYGILLFVLPCFAFDEGLGSIPLFIENVSRHAGKLLLWNHGTSFDKALISFFAILKNVFGLAMPFSFIKAWAPALNNLVLVVLALSALVPLKKWQRALCLVLGFLLFSDQNTYGTVFLTLPLVLYLKEEEVLTRRNALPFFALVFTLMAMPVFDNLGEPFSIASFRLQTGLVALMVYSIAVAGISAWRMVSELRSRCSEKSIPEPDKQEISY